MLEIDEIMPLYIEVDSDEAKPSHISNPLYAKNQAMVLLFEQFTKHFFMYVDDNGRLVCTERVGK